MIEAILINIAIAALLGVAAIMSFDRGLVAVAAGLVALVLGLLVAAVGYRWLGEVLSGLSIVLPLANVVAYVLLLVLTQFAVLLGIRHVTRYLPKSILASHFNRVGGTILGVAQMAVFVAIALAIFINLPVGAAQKTVVERAFLAKPLIQLGGRLQNIVNTAPGGDLTQTLRLLTVEPKSHESVALGYTTTNVRVDAVSEARMLDLVNRERTARGLSPLRINNQAQAVARTHSRDMFARGYFSHITPEGVDPFARMSVGGVSFISAGENLALGPTLARAHTGLMDSPGHRANILSPEFHTVGIGIIDSSVYGLMVTQDFTN